MIPEGEMWDRRFSEHVWPTDPDPLLVDLARALPPGRVIDLGSGPGRNSLWLAAKGWRVTAVDASRVALAQAAQRGAELGVGIEAVHADVTTWRAGQECYDLAVVANLHPGPDGLAAVLAAAAAALVSGGHLFVVGHDLSCLGRHGPPDPARLLTPERLGAAMPAEIAVQQLQRCARPPIGAAVPGDQPAQDIAVLAWGTKLRP